MAYNFLAGDREQQYLMPPSVADWLPENHLAWFILDAVDELDLDEFRRRYRTDGRGGAAYEPGMMVALLLYSYCLGDRSSRVIERRLVEDVAYRVIAANATPDHATIARFRAQHENALAALFKQVLALCAAAGLVRAGLLALDGTKIEADASGAANMTDERLAKAIEAEVTRMLAEAAAIDAAEDELYGEARGDELPPELADRSSRLRALREAKTRLEADAAKASPEPRSTPRTKAKPSKEPKADPAQKPLFVNATDPDSRPQRTASGFCQGYNAQAVATAEQVIVAAGLSVNGADVTQFAPMLAATEANLAALELTEQLGTLLADAGYYSTDNLNADTTAELLIATTKAAKLPTDASIDEDAVAVFEAEENAEARRRAAVLQRMLDGEIGIDAAAGEISLSVKRVYALKIRYLHGGVEAIVRQRRPVGGPGSRSSHRHRLARRKMEARLASAEGRALYKKRGQIIEPVFGQIKAARGIRRFQRRGLTACAAEWQLIATTHNLLKLWRQRKATAIAF